LNHDINLVSTVIKNTLKNKGYILAPYLTDFNNQAVKRIYTINNQKTII